MHSLEASAFLDQLEELGINVEVHHKKLRARHFVAFPSNEH